MNAADTTLEHKSNDSNTSEYKPSYYGGFNLLDDSKPTVFKSPKHGKLNGVNALSEWTIGNNRCKFYICKGSVVSFIGDAIVNAANERCTGGGFVDHAIAKAGGKVLQEFRNQLPIIKNTTNKRCLTGSAVITKSGIGSNDCSLQCKYVIHAVGPNYKVRSRHVTVKQCNKLLYNAYSQCMRLGEEYKLESIGFCLLSAGIFRGKQSLKKVLKIACRGIHDHIYEGCKAVYLIAYTKDEVDALKHVSSIVFGAPEIVYSKQK
eukprot:1091152_1